MWQNHVPTPPFMKPYMEFTPHHQATQYFDGLWDIREEAIWFELTQKKVNFHDSIPRYKKDEKFINYSQGHGHGSLSHVTKETATPAISASEPVTNQFVDVNEETLESAMTAVTMPALEDVEPLEGTAAPDTNTYEPAGNKFTRSHSPKTEDDDSEVEPLPSSLETPNSSLHQQDHQEQCEKEEQPSQPEALSATNPTDVKTDEVMVDPLQVLLASAQTALGSATVTEEEDLLLDVNDVTTTRVAARLPPEQTKDSSGGCKPDKKDNVQLTSADVGDNMEDI